MRYTVTIMSPSAKISVAAAFLFTLLSLAALDALLVERDLTASLTETPPPPEGASVEPPTPTAKSPRDLPRTIEEQGFFTQPTGEITLLRSVLPLSTPVFSRVLLKEEDRAGFIVWAETSDAQRYFTALKRALFLSFSKDVHGLKDETRTNLNGTEMALLTFVDPAILDERFLFIHIDNHLYEFHIPEGKEKVLDSLFEALTKELTMDN